MTKRKAIPTKPKAPELYDAYCELRRERNALIAARDALIALHFKKLELATKAAYKQGLKTGVFCAAELADSYNEITTHKFRLGDCILHKLNQTTRKHPRRNLKALKA